MHPEILAGFLVSLLYRSVRCRRESELRGSGPRPRRNGGRSLLRILALIALFGGAQRPPGKGGANPLRNEGVSNDEGANLPQRATVSPELIPPAPVIRYRPPRRAENYIKLPLSQQPDQRAGPGRR